MIRQEIAPTMVDPSPQPRKMRRTQHAKHYESLLMRLYLCHTDGQTLLPDVGVTSALHGEGVSTVSANLALHAAEVLSDQVLLLQSSSRPTLFGRKMRIRQSPGLSDIVDGQATLMECIQRTGNGRLMVLSAGNGSDRTRVIEPQQMADVLEDVREQFRFIVVDLPPVSDTGVCLGLTCHLNGVLLAIEAERVSQRTVTWAQQQLQHAGANVLGVVFNKRRTHIPRWFTGR